jgi:hypothetical protein
MRNERCPFEIRRIESTLTEISIIYYTCTMKPRQSRSRGTHKERTIRACVAHRQFESALQLNDCRADECQLIDIDERKIIDWVEQGKIPLISWTPSRGMQSEAYDLKKIKIIFGVLTHSWEDGIVHCGSDTRNKNDRRMHLCQRNALKTPSISYFRGAEVKRFKEYAALHRYAMHAMLHEGEKLSHQSDERRLGRSAGSISLGEDTAQDSKTRFQDRNEHENSTQ